MDWLVLTTDLRVLVGFNPDLEAAIKRLENIGSH
jgi:hypothetical protein